MIIVLNIRKKILNVYTRLFLEIHLVQTLGEETDSVLFIEGKLITEGEKLKMILMKKMLWSRILQPSDAQ